MSDFEDWSGTDASNNDAVPDGWPEGMDRDQVNNSARANMGAVRRDWDGTATGGGPWRNVTKDFAATRLSDTSIQIAGVDATGYFVANRKIKITYVSGNPGFAFVASSSYSAPNTTVNLEDFDDVAPDNVVRSSAAIDEVFVSNLLGGTSEHGAGRAAYEDSLGGFIEPSDLTAAAINTAITTAVADGLIVLLADDVYLIEDTVVLQSGLKMWGRGKDKTILRLNGTQNKDVIAATGNVSSVDLRHFSIDGNHSSQTTAGNGIDFQLSADFVTIEHLEITECFDNGITFSGAGFESYSEIYISDVLINGCGRSCLNINNPASSNLRIFLQRIHASQPADPIGAGIAPSDAIRIQGEVTMSDITAGVGAIAHSGALIHLVENQLSTDPFSAAYNCTLTGFRLSGGGVATTGLLIGGNGNHVSNGYVRASGVGSRPLVIDGLGPGSDEAYENLISNVTFDDGDYSEIATNGSNNKIVGCYFREQSADALRIAGDDNLLSSCTFDDGVDGVSIEATAEDNVVESCVFDTLSGNGIALASGATDNVLRGNVFRDVTGSDISDSGTSTVIDNNVPAGEESFTTKTDADFVSGASAAEQNITGLTGIAFPLGANGARTYAVEAIFTVRAATTNRDCTVRMYHGATGALGETLVSMRQVEINNVDEEKVVTLMAEITPTAAHLLGFSFQYSAAGDDGTVVCNASEHPEIRIRKVGGT